MVCGLSACRTKMDLMNMDMITCWSVILDHGAGSCKVQNHKPSILCFDRSARRCFTGSTTKKVCLVKKKPIKTSQHQSNAVSLTKNYLKITRKEKRCLKRTHTRQLSCTCPYFFLSWYFYCSLNAWQSLFWFGLNVQLYCCPFSSCS